MSTCTFTPRNCDLNVRTNCYDQHSTKLFIFHKFTYHSATASILLYFCLASIIKILIASLVNIWWNNCHRSYDINISTPIYMIHNQLEFPQLQLHIVTRNYYFKIGIEWIHKANRGIQYTELKNRWESSLMSIEKERIRNLWKITNKLFSWIISYDVTV